MKPGISKSGSETLTQKWGVTEHESLKMTHMTPMLWIAWYMRFQSSGRSGTSAATTGVGAVQITASAG